MKKSYWNVEPFIDALVAFRRKGSDPKIFAVWLFQKSLLSPQRKTVLTRILQI